MLAVNQVPGLTNGKGTGESVNHLSFLTARNLVISSLHKMYDSVNENVKV